MNKHEHISQTFLARFINRVMCNSQHNFETDHHLDQKNYKRGLYPFIPISIMSVIRAFEIIAKHLKEEKAPWPWYDRFFLDVGSGPGYIIALAEEFFDSWGHCNGIEICPEYTYNKVCKGEVFSRNALYFKDYSKYKIIYYYCPIENDRIQCRLEKIIESQMAVGSFLIPFLKKDYSINKDSRFKKVSRDLGYGCIYRKVSDVVK